ncbi:MAG: hypothetical protein AABX65_00270 [Nanoarchaeota archaeon]
MKEEIEGGLRNALDRGVSIEEAVQSFINAGYNQQEVREAAQAITQGATSTLNPELVSPPVKHFWRKHSTSTPPNNLRKSAPIVNTLPPSSALQQVKFSPPSPKINQPSALASPKPTSTQQSYLPTSQKPMLALQPLPAGQLSSIQHNRSGPKKSVIFLLIFILILLALIILGIIFSKEVISFFSNLLK